MKTIVRVEEFPQLGLALDLKTDAPRASNVPKLSGRAVLKAELPVYSPVLNPSLSDVVDLVRPVKEVSTPYDKSITAGKNTYVYDAHTYHTKVPPAGIAALINYYTNPGDTVLDPFCGSGMTGVAATELGRKVVLCDLSPAATFIARNLTLPVDVRGYNRAVQSLQRETLALERELYGIECRDCGRTVNALYTVWSCGHNCPHCHHEFLLWDVARDEKPRVRDSKILHEFPCPNCSRTLKKRNLPRTKRKPVAIGYKCCRRSLQEQTVSPSDKELSLIESIESDTDRMSHVWYPTTRFPIGVNTRQPIAAGIERIDQCYTRRSLLAYSTLWALAANWPEETLRSALLFTLTSLYQRITVFSEFRFWGGSGNTANYNVPAIMNEQNVFRTFERKAKTISLYLNAAPTSEREVRITTQSSTNLWQLPDESIDYVFTDPPFGANINYSEMNLLWESWLGVYTNPSEEAIVNKYQNKGEVQYEELLTRVFKEVHRVLKASAWMSVIFHNSSNDVWSALLRSLEGAGFQVHGSQIFDKKHGTFKQFVSYHSVGYDVVLHCRKHGIAAAPGKGAKESVRAFVRRKLCGDTNIYKVRYLHVNRNDEVDFRRLYSEWLTGQVTTGAVEMGFEEFRTTVIREISELPKQQEDESELTLRLGEKKYEAS